MSKFNSGDNVCVETREGKWNGVVLRAELIEKKRKSGEASTYWQYRVTHETTGQTEWIKEDCLKTNPVLVPPKTK